MLADLQALIRLQGTRDRIAGLSARIEYDIPARISELETILTGMKERLAEGQFGIDEGRRERARLEVELKGLEDKILKFKAALMQVRTNDEYRAALNEIDYAQRAKTDIENRVLELMEDAEARREEMKAIEAEHRTEQERISADRKELEREQREYEAERSQLEAELSEIEAGMTPAVLNTWKRIAAVRQGAALAEARRQDTPNGESGICGACNMRLRPPVYQQVKLNSTLTMCESCRRILYFVPPPADNPGHVGNGSHVKELVGPAVGKSATDTTTPVAPAAE